MPPPSFSRSESNRTRPKTLINATQFAIAAFASAGLAPTGAWACACGCAVFDVGTSTLLPSGPGGQVFLEYDFLSQTKNWSGSHSALAADNEDKRIRSDFYLAGGQYMFNDRWGAMVEVPVTTRYFRTEDEDNPGAFTHTAFGDVRLMGVYSGFSKDMSTGIIFGLKLPTGDHRYPNFDPDTEIGSGSTDLLLGAYHTGRFTKTGGWSYFGQALWQQELATQDGYRPGAEFNASAGLTYDKWKVGKVAIAPVMQVLVSNRQRDGGLVGEPEDTGYTRVLASPGVAVSFNRYKVYADVELPVYQQMNGNQLIAPYAVKAIVSYSF